MFSEGRFWVGLNLGGGIIPGTISQIGGRTNCRGSKGQRSGARANVVQPEGGGHKNGGIGRLINAIVGVVVRVLVMVIGVGVSSGIGNVFGISANGDGGDLAELGGGGSGGGVVGRGGGIMIGGRRVGHGGESAGEYRFIFFVFFFFGSD